MKKRDCQDSGVGRLITGYEMGQLDDADRDRFEEHLMVCDFCALEVENMYPVAVAMAANRESIIKRLAEDGITLAAANEEPRQAEQATKRRRTLEGKWERLMDATHKPGRRPVWTVLGTTAAVAVVIFAVYFGFVSDKGSRSDLYRPLISLHPLPYEGSMTLRGEGAPAGKEQFDRGMEAYLRADYRQAAKHLKEAVAKSPAQTQWLLYLGVCHYLQGDAVAAIKALEQADAGADGITKIQARWFLAQSHLLHGDRGSAEPMLEWIIQQNKVYSGDASTLLNGLRQLGSAGEFNDGMSPVVAFETT